MPFEYASREDEGNRNMGKLDGKVAVVTGGSHGMGESEARILAEEGATVVVADVLDDEGREVASKVGGMFTHLDVASEDDWARLVHDVTT
ncbi:MAG: SDR family NAD(P)-dependent oxidoreductase, partial [Leifsonia flava]